MSFDDIKTRMRLQEQKVELRQERDIFDLLGDETRILARERGLDADLLNRAMARDIILSVQGVSEGERRRRMEATFRRIGKGDEIEQYWSAMQVLWSKFGGITERIMKPRFQEQPSLPRIPTIQEAVALDEKMDDIIIKWFPSEDEVKIANRMLAVITTRYIRNRQLGFDGEDAAEQAQSEVDFPMNVTKDFLERIEKAFAEIREMIVSLGFDSR